MICCKHPSLSPTSAGIRDSITYADVGRDDVTKDQSWPRLPKVIVNGRNLGIHPHSPVLPDSIFLSIFQVLSVLDFFAMCVQGLVEEIDLGFSAARRSGCEDPGCSWFPMVFIVVAPSVHGCLHGAYLYLSIIN